MDIQTGELQYDRTCELPVKLFSRTMQYLNLSYNKLEEVPSSVCELKLLSQLDLSKWVKSTSFISRVDRP